MGYNELGPNKFTAFLGFCSVSAALGFISCFYAVSDLMYFLSKPYDLQNPSEIPANVSELIWTKALMINTALLSLFILQHSLQALPQVKQLFHNFGLNVLERTIYVIMTSITLRFLMTNWNYTRKYNLWEFNLNDNNIAYSFYITIHSLCWLCIYVGTISMDVCELLGLKQVFYLLSNKPDPLQLKSFELRRLYSHMRHPSFTALVIILWFFPIMSLDRILLNSFLTIYMYVAWTTDHSDYNYQTCQLKRKFEELKGYKNGRISY